MEQNNSPKERKTYNVKKISLTKFSKKIGKQVIIHILSTVDY